MPSTRCGLFFFAEIRGNIAASEISEVLEKIRSKEAQEEVVTWVQETFWEDVVTEMLKALIVWVREKTALVAVQEAVAVEMPEEVMEEVQRGNIVHDLDPAADLVHGRSFWCRPRTVIYAHRRPCPWPTPDHGRQRPWTPMAIDACNHPHPQPTTNLFHGLNSHPFIHTTFTVCPVYNPRLPTSTAVHTLSRQSHGQSP